MKPVCVPCERFMRPKKNGYWFVEGMPTHEHVQGAIGKDAAGWAPYKVWVGDLYVCPTCKTETVVGVARMPVSEHYQPGFDEVVARVDGVFVKDC